MTTHDRPDDGALVTVIQTDIDIGRDVYLRFSTGRLNDHGGEYEGEECAIAAAALTRHRLASTPANTAQVAPDGMTADGRQAFRSGVAWAVSFQAVRERAPDLNDVDEAFAAASPAQVASAPDRAGVAFAALRERMAKQIEEWRDDEPESDWWTYQRDFAAALAALSATPSREGEVEALRNVLHEIDIEAGNTIPPDGKVAAFAALERITRLINPFRLPKSAATKPEN